MWAEGDKPIVYLFAQCFWRMLGFLSLVGPLYMAKKKIVFVSAREGPLRP